MIKDVYLAGAVRTPHGGFCGGLSSLSAPQLGSITIRETLNRTNVDAKEIDEVIFGNVIQAGLGQNVARQASIGAGVDTSIGATTVNKVCGSGMRAVIMAAQAIQCGDAGMIVAGGCESMTNAPFLLPKARTGYRMGNGELVDSMIHDGLWDVYNHKHMGTCGDQCAAKYDFSKDDQDAFSIESFNRAASHWDNGFFANEVVPVEVKTRKETTRFERDEGVSKFRGEDALRKLRPAFGSDGTVTAGNASSISDGAAAMVVFNGEKKDALGLKPAARILGYANAAVDPEWFTIAPIHAMKKLSEKLSLPLAEVDFFEINEAFAVVAMVAMRELKLDHAKVNVAGGAVALGHPIGASGARIIGTLMSTLNHYDKRIGIACLCIGGGEASAIAVERCT